MHPISRPRMVIRIIFLLLVWISSLNIVTAADPTPPFEGEKSTWHDGYARFDYLMDDTTLEIQPFKRNADEKFGIKGEEVDEDAINSDLDDPDDLADGDEEDEDGNMGHIMLCMYDKVQRVKNKWCVYPPPSPLLKY